MFIQKNNLFLNLTKNQKSFLISYLKSFVKKHSEKNPEAILDIFIEDETYYFEIGNSHFEWIIELFEDNNFLREIKNLIGQYKSILAEKERRKPFLEKQKAFAKEQNKKFKTEKMKKEQPTPKQLKYYKNLCKRHRIEPDENLEQLSKYDLMTMLSNILEEHKDEPYEVLKELKKDV